MISTHSALSRERLAELLAFREPAIRAATSETIDENDYAVERVELDIEDTGRVRGFVTRPVEPERPAPAVLYNHSHGDRYDIGARELVDGREYLQTPLGPVLARAGYVTLCLDMPTFGERSTDTESAAAKAHLWYGTSLIGQMLSEGAAALTYLRSRPDVDADRIATFGISMGSTHAYWLAALDERIRAAAHLCCYADYATLVDLGAHDNHGIYLVVPGLLRETSTGAIAGLIAPRPQLICVGEDDELTPPESVARALAVTAPMYAAAGAPDALEVFVEPGVGHRETPAMRERVLTFLERSLASPTTR